MMSMEVVVVITSTLYKCLLKLLSLLAFRLTLCSSLELLTVQFCFDSCPLTFIGHFQEQIQFYNVKAILIKPYKPTMIKTSVDPGLVF